MSVSEQEKSLFIKGSVYANAAVMQRDGCFPELTIDDVALLIACECRANEFGRATDAEKQEAFFLHGLITALSQISRERGAGMGMSDDELYEKIACSSKTKDIVRAIWGFDEKGGK